LDPFVSDSHYGFTLAAEPGAGKSFALQDFITSQLAMGRYVYLLDNGESAKKLCMAVGGEYNSFGASNFDPPSLNPFTGLTDDQFNDEKEGIVALLMLMAFEGTQPDQPSRIAMSEAVQAAFDQAKGNADIPLVIECLKNSFRNNSATQNPNNVVVAMGNLIPLLNAFISSPSRGKFFNGSGTINPTKQFCVFEIKSLGKDEHLKKCVMFFVLNMLLSRIDTIKNKKLILVDEAHDLIEDETAGPAFEGIYLKGRKYKVCIGMVVQSVLKLSHTAAGATILHQSAWKLIMAQPPEEIDKAIKDEVMTSFKDDPYFAKIIRSVRSQKNVFSEILIIGRRTYEVVRLYVDKWTATLYGSEGDARDLIFEWIDNGMDPIEAVNKLVNDKNEQASKFIGTFVDHLKTGYDMSPVDITKAVEQHLLEN